MTRPRRRQAGEGTISEYQTKAGPRYLIKYKNPRDGEGPEWIVRRGFLTRKAAASALGDINSEIRRGSHVVPASMTFGQFAKTHLDGLRLAPGTIAGYRKMLRLHVLPKLGGVQLTSLTGTQLSALYRSLERNDLAD